MVHITQNILGPAVVIYIKRKQPKERALIQDAAIEMHAIRDSYLKFARSLLVENGVIAPNHNDFPQQ